MLPATARSSCGVLFLACLLLSAGEVAAQGVQHAHGSSRGSGAATVESSVIPPQAIATPSGRRPWLRLPPAPFEEINSPGDGRLGPTTTRVVTGRSNPSDPAGMESLMLTNQTQASVAPGVLRPLAQADTPLTTWMAALSLVGPRSPLTDPELQATLFIPSDQAWQAWLSAYGVSEASQVPVQVLAAVVNQMVVPGVVLRQGQLQEGVTLTTAAGGRISIGANQQILSQAGGKASLTEANIQSGQAVGHIIDAVLVPAADAAAAGGAKSAAPTFDTAAAALQAPDSQARLFDKLVQAADMEDVLGDFHAGVTWVVPSDKALIDLLGASLAAPSTLLSVPRYVAEAFVISHQINAAAIDVTAMLVRLGRSISTVQNLSLSVQLEATVGGSYRMETGGAQPKTLVDSGVSSISSSSGALTAVASNDRSANKDYVTAQRALAAGTAQLSLGDRLVTQAGVVGGRSVVYVVEGHLASPQVAASLKAAAAGVPVSEQYIASMVGGSSSPKGSQSPEAARSSGSNSVQSCAVSLLALATALATLGLLG